MLIRATHALHDDHLYDGCQCLLSHSSTSHSKCLPHFLYYSQCRCIFLTSTSSPSSRYKCQCTLLQYIFPSLMFLVKWRNSEPQYNIEAKIDITNICIEFVGNSPLKDSRQSVHVCHTGTNVACFEHFPSTTKRMHYWSIRDPRYRMCIYMCLSGSREQ